jgi:hypothetical protein
MGGAIRFVSDNRWRANVPVSRKDGEMNMVGPLADACYARIMDARTHLTAAGYNCYQWYQFYPEVPHAEEADSYQGRTGSFVRVD